MSARDELTARSAARGHREEAEAYFEQRDADAGLFDLPPGQERMLRADREKMSADRRRTQRQHEAIAAGLHPLSMALDTKIRLLPYSADGPLTCGDCRFRKLFSHHNRAYPKCTWGSVSRKKIGILGDPYTATEYPRLSNGAGTDIRAFWPACTEFQPKEETCESSG